METRVDWPDLKNVQIILLQWANYYLHIDNPGFSDFKAHPIATLVRKFGAWGENIGIYGRMKAELYVKDVLKKNSGLNLLLMVVEAVLKDADGPLGGSRQFRMRLMEGICECFGDDISLINDKATTHVVKHNQALLKKKRQEKLNLKNPIDEIELLSKEERDAEREVGMKKKKELDKREFKIRLLHLRILERMQHHYPHVELNSPFVSRIKKP